MRKCIDYSPARPGSSRFVEFALLKSIELVLDHSSSRSFTKERILQYDSSIEDCRATFSLE